MKTKFTLLLFICFSISFAQTDTVSIYFEIGRHETSDSELTKLKIDKGAWTKVDVISYTDYLGSVKFNNKLSESRSFEVRSRLVEYGLNTEILGNVEGKGITGETLASKKGIRKNRRTDIIIWEIAETSENQQLISTKKIIPKEKLSQRVGKAKIGDQLVIKGLDFIPGQHFPTLEGNSAFIELLEILREKESIEINIEGHICCNLTGGDGLDMTTNKLNLSEARAEYVYNRLIEEGIDSGRLSFEGFARKNPIYPNEATDEHKQANRRVEITILGK